MEPKSTNINYDRLERQLESIAPRRKTRTEAPSVEDIRAALTTYAQVDDDPDQGEQLDSEDVPVGPRGDGPIPDPEFLDFADEWLKQNPDASPDDLVPMETDRVIGDQLQGGLDLGEYAREKLSQLPPEIQEIIDQATHGPRMAQVSDDTRPPRPRRWKGDPTSGPSRMSPQMADAIREMFGPGSAPMEAYTPEQLIEEYGEHKHGSPPGRRYPTTPGKGLADYLEGKLNTEFTSMHNMMMTDEQKMQKLQPIIDRIRERYGIEMEFDGEWFHSNVIGRRDAAIDDIDTIVAQAFEDETPEDTMAFDDGDIWDDIIRRVQDSGQDTRCPQCPGDQPMILGPLGDLLHVRCQHCGWDYALKIPPEEPLPEPEKPGLPTDLARDDSNRFVQLGGHVLPSGSQIRRAHHSRETQADEPRNLGEEPKDEAHRCPKCGGSGNYVGGRFTEENPGTCYACGGTGRKKASVSNRFTRFTQSGNPMGDVGDLLDFNARGGRKFLSGKDYPKVCPTCQATIDQIAELFEAGELPDTDDPEAPIMFAYDHALLCGGRNCAEREQHEQNRFKTREQEDAEHEEFMAKGRGRLEDDLEMKGIGLASASNPSLVRMANLGQVGRGIGKFFSDPINAVGAGAVAGTLLGGAAATSGDRAYHQQQQGKQLLPRIPSKWNMQHRFDQPTQRVENPNQFVQHNFIDPYKEQGSYTLTPSQATPQQKMQFLHKHLYEIDKQLRDPNTTLLDRSRLQRQKLQIMGAGKVTRYEAGMGGGVSTDDMVNYFQQNVNPMASRSTTASSNSRFIRIAQSGGSRVIYQGPEGLVLQSQDGSLEVFAPTDVQAPGTISIGGQTYAPVRTIPPQDAEELMSDIDVQDMADRYDPSGMGGPGNSVVPTELPGFDMQASPHPRSVRMAADFHDLQPDPFLEMVQGDLETVKRQRGRRWKEGHQWALKLKDLFPEEGGAGGSDDFLQALREWALESEERPREVERPRDVGRKQIPRSDIVLDSGTHSRSTRIADRGPSNEVERILQDGMNVRRSIDMDVRRVAAMAAEADARGEYGVADSMDAAMSRTAQLGYGYGNVLMPSYTQMKRDRAGMNERELRNHLRTRDPKVTLGDRLLGIVDPDEYSRRTIREITNSWNRGVPPLPSYTQEWARGQSERDRWQKNHLMNMDPKVTLGDRLLGIVDPAEYNRRTMREITKYRGFEKPHNSWNPGSKQPHNVFDVWRAETNEQVPFSTWQQGRTRNVNTRIDPRTGYRITGPDMDSPMMQKMLSATQAINENAPGYVARPGARPNPTNPNWLADAQGQIRNI